MSHVLVTGGSGFVGNHLLLRLLADDHTVRATVRDPGREDEVRALLARAGAAHTDQLSFSVADLERDEGWTQACAGCDYVMHAASPFPASLPAHEDELIVPARAGTLRVLRAARDAGVKRVVLTSSFAAVGYGQDTRATPFEESNWTDPDARNLRAYIKSKTLAERAAWDFIQREGGGLELSTINPVGIFGPVLGPDLSTSTLIIKGMMNGALPRVPRIYFGVVDVRDVADLHLKAMLHPEAKAERFLAVAGDCISLLDAATILRRAFGSAASKVPTVEAADWMMRILAIWDARARSVLPDLGKVRNASSAKAQRVLGWSPRPADEAITATAESLIRLQLLK